MISVSDLAILFGIGSFAGIIIGLVGASGAVVMISLLHLLLGFSIHKSIGTTLLASFIASSVVSSVYYKNRNIDFRSCIWLLIGAILGSQIGAFLAFKTPETQLKGLLGIVLIFMGVYLWKRGFDREEVVKRFGRIFKIEGKNAKIILGIGIGLWVGIIASLLGAAGGVWFFAVLLLVFGLPLHKAIGGATFLMALTALFATSAHFLHGNVDMIGGLIVGIGAAISGNMSAKFANKSTEEILIRTISVLFVVLGISMLILEFFNLR